MQFFSSRTLNNGYFKRLPTISGWLVLAGVVIAGMLPGQIVLSSPRLNHLEASSLAQAQQQPGFGDGEISSYARSVLDIEQRRKQAYQEIEALGGKPDVFCGDAKTVNRLKRDMRQIAINYCNQAKTSIESNGLTISRFNEITESLRADPKLQKRIQAELLRLQSSSSS